MSAINVSRPSGEAKIISDSENAVYNFTDFLEMPMPSRKRSSELPNLKKRKQLRQFERVTLNTTPNVAVHT